MSTESKEIQKLAEITEVKIERGTLFIYLDINFSVPRIEVCINDPIKLNKPQDTTSAKHVQRSLDLESRNKIIEVCEEIKELLVKKNESYGSAFLEPAGIFAKLPPLQQINVRIDDKLNRIAKGNEYQGDDTELDLIGYLILKRVARRILK